MWTPFQYRDFWDVPRVLVASYGNDFLLLSCRFDDELDEYLDTYEVYRLKEYDSTQFEGSWKGIEELASDQLGRIAVRDIEFDESRRRQINLDFVSSLAKDD